MAAGAPVVCKACNSENPPGMKFCRACGSALAAIVAVAPAPLPSMPGPVPAAPAVRPSGSTACPRCGTPAPAGFAYCQQCGLPLQGVAPTDPGQSARPRSPSAVGSPDVDGYGATLSKPDSAVRTNRPSGPSAPSSESAAVWGTAVLVNRDGSDGVRFPLASADTVIGRAGADIAFDDDRFLARSHARIERAADGAVRIHPLETLNGVFKKAIQPVELADGAIVLVGREVLRFEKVSPEERAAQPLVRYGVSVFGSPPRDPWGRLVQLIPNGSYRDVRHLLADEIVIGREDGDIVFRDDAFLSRRHAAFTWDAKRGVCTLTDLGSSNGTFVRVGGPTRLEHGDQVRVGDQLLRVELGAPRG